MVGVDQLHDVWMVQLLHHLQLLLGVHKSVLVSVFFGGVSLAILDLLDKVDCTKTPLSQFFNKGVFFLVGVKRFS